MFRLGVAVTVVLVWMIFPATLVAQRSGGGESSRRTLSGTVYYPGNKAAENVTVELHSTEGSLMSPASTTASGGYEFHNLTSGTYALVVDQQGYQRVELTVDLTLTSEKGIIIYLTPKAGNSAPAKPASTVSSHELSMPQKARELMDSGKKKLYQERDAQGALEDFQHAVSEAQDYYEADYQIAMADLSLGKPEDAEKSFRKSIEVSGDKYGEADVGLGMMMLDRDDSGGEKLVRRGIELSPSYWRGYYELGRVELKARHLSEAQKYAEKARTLAPNAAVVYRLLSNVHLQEKNYPSLLEDLDAYIKLDPDSPAGARAKQMREEVQQKIDAKKSEDLKP